MKCLLTWTAFLLIYSSSVFSQTEEKERDSFDEAFLHIYMYKASKDVQLALRSADSLYRIATSDIHKVRALMLISDMYHRMANRDSSIYHAVEAGQLAERAGIYDWQARIYGVLSTQYRETGFLGEGKKQLEKGLEIIKKIDNPERVGLYKGQFHQEMGFYALEEKDYGNAVQYFKQAKVFFEGLPTSPIVNFSLAQNEERLGLCYLELSAIDSAKLHYLNALILESSASEADTPLKGFIQSGLGRVYVLQGLYEEAYGYLEDALEIAEATGFPHLKISVYKSLSLYHKATRNNDDYVYYHEKYLEAERTNTVEHKKYADNIVASIQQRLVELTASNKAISVTASALIVVIGIGVWMYVGKQRRNQLRFKALISQLRNDRLVNGERTSVIAHPKDRDLMPERTKQELLKKLERFESAQQFTDKNISIAVLAGKMKTNTKYLSYIINTYRHKDFNAYINELRIQYIMSKIQEDSRYLNYKISYLAEECGFATHSQFTTVFKNVTGLSPSSFMNYVRKNHNVEELDTVGS